MSEAENHIGESSLCVYISLIYNPRISFYGTYVALMLLATWEQGNYGLWVRRSFTRTNSFPTADNDTALSKMTFHFLCNASRQSSITFLSVHLTLPSKIMTECGWPTSSLKSTISAMFLSDSCFSNLFLQDFKIDTNQDRHESNLSPSVTLNGQSRTLNKTSTVLSFTCKVYTTVTPHTTNINTKTNIKTKCPQN